MSLETSPSDEWLPDELLFSLASRHHVTACHVRAADTCKALFGHYRAGSAHDFPSRIDEFARRSGGLLGDAESIIRQHTILAFYLPVQSPRSAADAAASMRGDAIGPLKATLGLLASGFGASHPLKACPQCMKADVHSFGTAYWHRAHQLPGAWICLTHDVPLLMSTVKSTGVGRFLWYLPDHRGLKGPWLTLQSPEPIELWRGLTECIENMAGLPVGFHFEPKRLMAAHRAAAARRGFISSTGQLLPAALGQKILETTRVLAHAQDLLRVASNERAAVAQFARLLYQPRRRTHPLKHCILALSLHGGWSDFMTNYRGATEGPPYTAPNGLRTASNKPSHAIPTPARQELIDLMRNGAQSATAAARATGVAVATAMAWANDAGIRVAPRAKTLKPEVRMQAVDALRRGKPKQEVAKAVGVSVTTITRLLRTEHGLREMWRQATTAGIKRKARSDWLAAARRRPGASPTEVRRFAPAAFAWLYRNDRAWLEERAKQLSPAIRTRTPRVDWDGRDEALSLEVLKASAALNQQRQGRRITLGVVCQHVPSLKALVNKLDRLPRTRVALDLVIRRRNAPQDQIDLFEE